MNSNNARISAAEPAADTPTAAPWHGLAAPAAHNALPPIRPVDMARLADPFLHSRGAWPAAGPLIGGGDIQTAAFDRFGAVAMHRAAEIGLRVLIARIESFEAGVGKYAAHLLFGNSTSSAGANLNLPEGLSDTGNNNALLVNLAEVGGGHLLPLQSVHCGVMAGMTSEATPRAIVMVHHTGPVIQPVQILTDGGADGSSTASASWTYTIMSLDGSQILNRQTPLARPRPAGSTIVQSASPAFGTAFVDAGGTWRLWDAGEVPATTACS
ncbi:MAG: hypothetical protein ACP5O1_09215 [Phycisphaerae bacterium]